MADADDHFGGAAGVEGRGGVLLQDGVGEDLAQGALVDWGRLSLVEAEFEAAVLLGDVADVYDQADIDGVGLQAKGAAVAGESVEEGVGGGIVGLAFLADDAGSAGEEGEEVEGLLLEQLGCSVEVPGSLDLGASGDMVVI